jgi:hypothetical protein
MAGPQSTSQYIAAHIEKVAAELAADGVPVGEARARAYNLLIAKLAVSRADLLRRHLPRMVAEQARLVLNADPRGRA